MRSYSYVDASDISTNPTQVAQSLFDYVSFRMNDTDSEIWVNEVSRASGTVTFSSGYTSFVLANRAESTAGANIEVRELVITKLLSSAQRAKVWQQLKEIKNL